MTSDMPDADLWRADGFDSLMNDAYTFAHELASIGAFGWAGFAAGTYGGRIVGGVIGGVVDVGQEGEGRAGEGLELLREGLAVGGDRDHLAAERLDPALRPARSPPS